MTGYASLGEVAEALRRLAANIEGPRAPVSQPYHSPSPGAWLIDHRPTRNTQRKAQP